MTAGLARQGPEFESDSAHRRAADFELLQPLFSCVAENSAVYFRMVEALAMSLRAFGGAVSDAPFVANFIRDVRDRYVSRLHELDVDVRIVEPFETGSAHANKLRMLELATSREFDVLVALDCDIVLVGDVSKWLSVERFGAKPADYDYAAGAEWALLFRRLGIEPPPRTAVATSTGRTMVPYFNSGVMFIPRWLCSQLLNAWRGTLAEIHAYAEIEPSALPFPFVSDQVALACAVQRLGAPYGMLPVGLNFPTH